MTSQRQPHAPTNLESRKLKGLKIERLLQLNNISHTLRLLEIGTGSGGISNYFGAHDSRKFVVDSVDVNDVRIIKDGYQFHLVEDTDLPFSDHTFDVVISNHVIEHVGDAAAQLRHLRQIHRVLKRDGVGYLALPNRWMLIEPHYNLAFLSWLPHRVRTPYLRLCKRGTVYDCEPLEMWELKQMLSLSNLHGENLCAEALIQTLEIERPSSLLTTIFKKLPKNFIRFFSPVIPTFIYAVRRYE